MHYVLVLEAPQIVVSAEDALNVTVGSNVTFEIRASGDLLEYLWEGLDGRSLVQRPRFLGTRTNILVVSGVQFGDAGTYVGVVSNRAGTANSTAVLTVGEWPYCL